MKLLSQEERRSQGKHLEQLIHAQDKIRAHEIIARLHPVEAAQVVSNLSQEDQDALFDLLSAVEAADVLDQMQTPDQVAILSAMTAEEAAHIVEEMAPDEAADVLSHISPLRTFEILSRMRHEQAEEAQKLLAYPEDSAGALMSTEFMAFPETLTIAETIERLRRSLVAQNTERFNYLYVTDGKGRLVGVLVVRDLIIKHPQLLISQIMHAKVVSVLVTTPRREVGRIFRQYNLHALPVIDNNQKIIGIITADDAAELIHELATEDVLKLEGISTEQTRSMPWWKISRLRLSWLSVNIFLNMVAASVIAYYQDTLRAAIAVAVFLPIISDMSGCSGMQSVAVSVRDLALDRTKSRDFVEVFLKEFTVGIVNGAVLGLQIGLVAWLWKGEIILGAVVAFALWINTILAVVIGGLLPLGLKRFRLDPAIASGPVLTTITDMAGFATVLSLATRFLPFLTTP